MKYTISSLAKLLNVSSMTIRRYAEMGYITPEKNKKNNYTYYNSEDINTIIRVRMYRKFGFSHEEIRKMLECDTDEMIEIFEGHFEEMNREFEKLKNLKQMLKANMTMIKRIDEYEKNYITQNVEATYYIIYQEGDKILEERERLASIQNFMYNLPETKEISIYKKDDLENNSFNCSLGFAAKKKDTDRFNVEINEYMVFQPSQKCIYCLLKTYAGGDEVIEKNNKIKSESFKKAMDYLKQENLRLNNNVLGFNITSALENNILMNYTLICMPVEEIQ